MVDQLPMSDPAFTLDSIEVRVGDYFPQIVSAQSGERGFRMRYGSRLAEAAQQPFEILGDFVAVRSEPLLAALNAT